MKTLFIVQSESPWKKLYVFANGYDEAARKAINYLLDEQEKKEAERDLLDEDGSLYNLRPFKDKKKELPEIKSIEQLTSEIIQ